HLRGGIVVVEKNTQAIVQAVFLDPLHGTHFFGQLRISGVDRRGNEQQTSQDCSNAPAGPVDTFSHSSSSSRGKPIVQGLGRVEKRRRRCNSSAMSFGSGAVQCRRRPVAGWSKPRELACKVIREAPLPSDAGRPWRGRS